jgi:hypothetical protein
MVNGVYHLAVWNSIDGGLMVNGVYHLAVWNSIDGGLMVYRVHHLAGRSGVDLIFFRDHRDVVPASITTSTAVAAPTNPSLILGKLQVLDDGWLAHVVCPHQVFYGGVTVFAAFVHEPDAQDQENAARIAW